MIITKLGQRCLLIKEGNIKILIDPGAYPERKNNLKNIDFVLFTHVYSDHFHINSLKILLKNNPKLKIITNRSVGLILITGQGSKSRNAFSRALRTLNTIGSIL